MVSEKIKQEINRRRNAALAGASPMILDFLLASQIRHFYLNHFLPEPTQCSDIRIRVGG